MSMAQSLFYRQTYGRVPKGCKGYLRLALRKQDEFRLYTTRSHRSCRRWKALEECYCRECHKYRGDT
jgi:hypothetical protein